MNRRQLKNRVLVVDAQSMRFEEWNGHLRVMNTNLTKANICEYYGFEIKNHQKYGLEPDQAYRFLRSPDALEKAVTSFKERPVLYVHKAADARQIDNSKIIGTTGSDPSFSFPYIQSSLTIWDGDYIEAIKSNQQAELSASYAFTPVMESGTFEGEPYDGVMTDIYVDHIALVEQGRAGPDVRVADAMLGEEMQKLNKQGLKIVQIVQEVINPSGTVNDSRWNEIAGVVTAVSGVQRQNLVPVLTSLLKGHAIASDEEAEKAGGAVQKVMDEEPENRAEDEDSVDTVEKKEQAETGDEGGEPADESAASDEDEEEKKERAETGDARSSSIQRVKGKAAAFDAAAFERHITQKVEGRLKQAQEAKAIIRPLVGEWASAADSGVDILRGALEQATGKTPPVNMNYEQLKYTVDLAIAQKRSAQANDHKRVNINDLQRFGADRLKRI